MSIVYTPSSIPLRIPFAPNRRFNFTKPIRVTNLTTKLTDYQIAVNLDTTNFAFEKARADGADIRFQDANGKALKYWIESWASVSAKIWVKLDELESYEDRIIWLVYGNDEASSETDIANTFIDGWDFEADSIGETPPGWTENAYCTFRTIAGKKAEHDQTSSGGHGTAYRSFTNITEDNNRYFEFDIIIKSTVANTKHYIILHDQTDYALEGIFLIFNTSGQIQYHDGSWHTLQSYTQNTDYHIKIYNIDLTNNQYDIDINDANKGTNLGFAAAQSNINYLTLTTYSTYTNALIDYDNLLLRKYISPNPLVEVL